jgi:hypothetical protein
MTYFHNNNNIIILIIISIPDHLFIHLYDIFFIFTEPGKVVGTLGYRTTTNMHKIIDLLCFIRIKIFIFLYIVVERVRHTRSTSVWEVAERSPFFLLRAKVCTVLLSLLLLANMQKYL